MAGVYSNNNKNEDRLKVVIACMVIILLISIFGVITFVLQLRGLYIAVNIFLN